MLNNFGLGFVFTARDFASTAMQRLERQFLRLDATSATAATGVTRAFGEIGAGLALLAGGGALLAGAFDLAGAAGRFEQQLAAVGAVSRATSAELAMLRDAAVRGGMVTQFSPDEAAAGLTTLATAGQTARQAVQTLLPVLDLAAGSIGQLGVDQAADAIVGTLNAYGLAATEATNVTDRLLRITQLSNFQARDFEGGLAKAAATGAVFGQSLDDVLITLGLLRNRNIDASSSGTAFREATRRVGGEMRAMNALTEAGIEIFDAHSGRMRSIVDIMLDFRDATAGMTEAERNNRINVAFGARGMLAYNAVMNASFTTMRDGAQVTLLGRDAVAALRQEMGRAAGTALDFRERLADTFEGQKTLLRGVVQTIAVTLGEPFAQVLKPIVMTLVRATSALVDLIEATPAPLKRLAAGATVVLGGLAALAGGALVVKGAWTLLGLAASALGVTFGGVLAAVAPVVAAVAGVGIAVAGLATAVARDVGGIGTLFARTTGRVSLAWRALSQLFSDGGFSGAILEDLGRAEHAGLKRFVIGLYQLAFRLGRIGAGVRDGFGAAIEAAAPAVQALGAALTGVAQHARAFLAPWLGGASALPSERYARFGAAIGRVAGAFAAAAITVGAWVGRLASGLLRGLGVAMGVLQPSVTALVEALAGFGRALGYLWTGGQGSVDLWTVFGAVLEGVGVVVGTVAGALAALAAQLMRGTVLAVAVAGYAIGALVRGVIGFAEGLGELAARLFLWFTTDVPAAFGAAIDAFVRGATSVGDWLASLSDAVGGWVTRAGNLAAAALQPVADFIARISDAVAALFGQLSQLAGRVASVLPGSLLPAGLRAEPAATAPGVVVQAARARRPAQAGDAMPAATEHRERTSLLSSFLTQAAPAPSPVAPVHVRLEVDGETLAQVTADANQRRANRTFTPVPVF